MTYQKQIDRFIGEIRTVLTDRLSTQPGLTTIALTWCIDDIPGETVEELSNTRDRIFDVFKEFRFRITGTENFDYGFRLAIVAERIDPTAPAELVMRGMAEKEFDESLHRSGYRAKK